MSGELIVLAIVAVLAVVWYLRRRPRVEGHDTPPRERREERRLVESWAEHRRRYGLLYRGVLAAAFALSAGAVLYSFITAPTFGTITVGDVLRNWSLDRQFLILLFLAFAVAFVVLVGTPVTRTIVNILIGSVAVVSGLAWILTGATQYGGGSATAGITMRPYDVVDPPRKGRLPMPGGVNSASVILRIREGEYVVWDNDSRDFRVNCVYRETDTDGNPKVVSYGEGGPSCPNNIIGVYVTNLRTTPHEAGYEIRKKQIF
jgi:hypothetical protein